MKIKFYKHLLNGVLEELNLIHGFSIYSIIRLEIRWRTHAGYCFNTSCVLLPGCKGLRKYKKQIERDEEIAEELQDGNKSDRGAESQDS